jgi:hypothetical protein
MKRTHVVLPLSLLTVAVSAAAQTSGQQNQTACGN